MMLVHGHSYPHRGTASVAGEFGSSTMPQYLRSPYIFYEKCVSELISSQDQVLELGAGTGLHTWALVHRRSQ